MKGIKYVLKSHLQVIIHLQNFRMFESFFFLENSIGGYFFKASGRGEDEITLLQHQFI